MKGMFPLFKILIAEDDKNTAKWMKAVITGEGYEVFLAENGHVALDVMDKQHIDLMIIDIMMPGLDGLELTQLIRGSGSTIPILMVTAKQLPKDKRDGFLAGTDDYLVKPVDEQEMLLRIRALLRRAQIVIERKLRIGNMILDYDSLTVTHNGEHHSLPQKEFQLLYKLVFPQ